MMDSLTIDLHRLGSLSASGLIRKDEIYIALAGSDEPPVKCEMQLEHEEFLTQLHCLRYPDSSTAEKVAGALELLGSHAAELLPELPEATEPLQIDLVLGAAELWAFPFEACASSGAPLFADSSRPLILTRRVRQGFAGKKRSWPVSPRVLFLHAPEASDLKQSLIDQHAEALSEALRPWSPSGDPIRDGLLKVELALGPRDVAKAVRRARESKSPYTHVHLLAHGKSVRDPITDSLLWGIRLGDEGSPAPPEEVAAALEPQDHLPVVITVATCDAANQAQTAIPKRSVAQELHSRGVPVVLAPQLPLTQPGSVTMTRTFYRPLLAGEDVRLALHQARLALRDDADAGHDWASLVGYVQLPEGYADHLVEVSVQREMELLKAARKRLEAVAEAADPETDRVLAALGGELTQRVASLSRRLETIPETWRDLRSECHGILASAYKRLAEVELHRAERAAQLGEQADSEALAAMSKEHLRDSLEAYRSAYKADIQNHWLGAQQLALERVLDGELKESRDWDVTLYAAELVAARNEGEYWAHGTIAELQLLAERLPEAKAALEELVSQAAKAAAAGDGGAGYAVPSTRDQLDRYVSWWTTDHGFFAGGADLSAEATELLQYLNERTQGE
jgi:hypothetical protein